MIIITIFGILTNSWNCISTGKTDINKILPSFEDGKCETVCKVLKLHGPLLTQSMLTAVCWDGLLSGLCRPAWKNLILILGLQDVKLVQNKCARGMKHYLGGSKMWAQSPFCPCLGPVAGSFQFTVKLVRLGYTVE